MGGNEDGRRQCYGRSGPRASDTGLACGERRCGGESYGRVLLPHAAARCESRDSRCCHPGKTDRGLQKVFGRGTPELNLSSFSQKDAVGRRRFAPRGGRGRPPHTSQSKLQTASTSAQITPEREAVV